MTLIAVQMRVQDIFQAGYRIGHVIAFAGPAGLFDCMTQLPPAVPSKQD